MKTVQETLREMDKEELMQKFWGNIPVSWIALMMS